MAWIYWHCDPLDMAWIYWARDLWVDPRHAWMAWCRSIPPGVARRYLDQYRMRVRNVPGIAASSSRTALACSSLAVMSITT